MIQDDLETNEALVAASVAIYMFMVGVSALVWGPASDYFGRKATYYMGGAGFITTTMVCIFAPNIGVLVAFRALQGAAGAGGGEGSGFGCSRGACCKGTMVCKALLGAAGAHHGAKGGLRGGLPACGV